MDGKGIFEFPLGDSFSRFDKVSAGLFQVEFSGLQFVFETRDLLDQAVAFLPIFRSSLNDFSLGGIQFDEKLVYVFGPCRTVGKIPRSIDGIT